MSDYMTYKLFINFFFLGALLYMINEFTYSRFKKILISITTTMIILFMFAVFL